MSFNPNMPQPDSSIENIISKESMDKLNHLIEEYANKLKKEGILVTSDCRIDMDSFNNVYSEKEIETDKQYIAKLKEKFSKNSELLGEPVELLITIIWNKVLGKELIAVRSAMFDDIKNGVDHLIIEKNTGKVICFIDGVSSLNSEAAKKKREKSGLSKNIKYGFTIKNGKINLTELKNVPIFYIGIPLTQIKNFINELTESTDDAPSKIEKDLMTFCFKILTLQIKERHLNKVAKDLLDHIPDSIKKEISTFLKSK